MIKSTLICLEGNPIARMNGELYTPQLKIHYKGKDYVEWDIVDDFTNDSEVIRIVHLNN